MHPAHYYDLKLVLHSKVEDLDCRNYAWTDHHLVYTDFDTGIHMEPYPDMPFTKFLFRTVSGTPVKYNDDEKVQWYELREATTDTPGNRKQQKIWDKIQKAAKSVPIQDQLKLMVQLLNEAEADLRDAANILNLDNAPIHRANTITQSLHSTDFTLFLFFFFFRHSGVASWDQR